MVVTALKRDAIRAFFSFDFFFSSFCLNLASSWALSPPCSQTFMANFQTNLQQEFGIEHEWDMLWVLGQLQHQAKASSNMSKNFKHDLGQILGCKKCLLNCPPAVWKCCRRDPLPLLCLPQPFLGLYLQPQWRWRCRWRWCRRRAPRCSRSSPPAPGDDSRRSDYQFNEKNQVLACKITPH